jgi:hypothetical protein
VSLLFVLVNRTGCFAISDQPALSADGIGTQSVFGYHLGMISVRCHPPSTIAEPSIHQVLTTFFDCLNMFIVVRRCIQERGTLGTLGQSFLQQGVLVYIITTTMNMLAIVTFFNSDLIRGVKTIGPWFAYILPSPLSCRLVLMLRRTASPTETELRIEYSHMIDEALENITEEEPESFLPSISIDDQVHPSCAWACLPRHTTTDKPTERR